MKDGADAIIEKPFSCDIDECCMRFTNEDHLMVHKKRHDMVLNIGLGPKGNNFSDQTPTPTRFIRNCEEVGLFQDLQYVNPFEETFKKAIEAVKSGQAPPLEKSLQSNPTDDTLHTPNIFPHITDLPCTHSSKDLVPENVRETGEDLSKTDGSKDLNGDKKDLRAKIDSEPEKLVENMAKEKEVNVMEDTHVIEAIDNNNFTWLLNQEKNLSNPYEENIILSNNDIGMNKVHVALREKIKSNIYNTQVPMIVQLKVPIPRATSTGLYQKRPKYSFATFSKNSLKHEAKQEKQESGSSDLSKKKRVKKNNNSLQKERLEILERNRAAAIRCREKKKIYVSYLEQLNTDLKAANKNLQVVNTSLKRQILVLQAELMKHKNCSLSQSKTGTVVSSVADNNAEDQAGLNKSPCENETKAGKPQENDISDGCSETTKGDPAMLDIVEVSLYDDNIFGSDKNPAVQGYVDIVDVANDNSDLYPSKGSCKVQNLRKFYTDHSYFNDPNGSVTKRGGLTSKVIKPKPVAGCFKDHKFQVANVELDRNVIGVLIPPGNDTIFHTGLGDTSQINYHHSVSHPILPLKSSHKRKCKNLTEQ